MKNKIFSIILSIVLSLPIMVWAVDNDIITEQNEDTPIVNTLDEEADVSETNYKQPNSNRKIVKKFLAAMGGVGISSFAIFFLLTIYNRIRENYSRAKTLDGEVTLETPQDLDEALKVFLEKTKW